MSLYRRPNGYYAIDVTDARLPDGRLAISARTKKKGEADKRHATVLLMIEQGRTEILALLGKPAKAGGISIALLQQAVSRDELGALASGAGRESATVWMGEAIDRLLRTVKATRSPATHEVYSNLLGALERKFGVTRDAKGKITADVSLASVTIDQLGDWLHEPKEKAVGGKEWSPRRQHAARIIVQKLFRTEIARSEERAHQTGTPQELKRNPMAHVQRAKIRQTRVEFLRPAEWRVLIGKAEDRPIAAGLALWCLAGLRLMEAAYLRPGLDLILDGDRPVIKVQARKGEHPWRPKTDRSERDVPIVPGGELHRLLLRHRELGYAGERYFIHPAREDRPYGPEGLRKLAKEVFVAAGIRWGGLGDALSIHSLRHTFVSWLVQEDVQALKIARLIGDRAEQIYNTYGHLLPSDLETVMRVSDGIAKERKLNELPLFLPLLDRPRP